RAGDLARHLCRLQPRPAWGRPRGRRCVAPRGARPQSGDARGNRPGAGADLDRRSPPDRGGPRRPRAGPHHRHPAAAKTGPRGAPVAAAVRGAVGPRRPHGGPATGGRSPAGPPRAGLDGPGRPRRRRGGRAHRQRHCRPLHRRRWRAVAVRHRCRGHLGPRRARHPAVRRGVRAPRRRHRRMGAALRGRAPGRAAGPLRCPAADRPGFGRCDGLMPAARLTPPRSGGPSSAERLLAQIRIPDADRIRGSISLPLTLPGAPDVPVTWSSSAPEIISERTINGVAPGVVRRPPAGGEPADVRLVAYVHLPHGVLQREFRVTVLPAIELARTSRYAMVNFARSNSHEGQQLYFAVSEGDDPTSWQAVNSGRAVLESTAGMRAVRDPSIVRSPEGDRFFLVATDLNVDAPERGWRGWDWAQSGASRYLEVWESSDLRTWS